MLNRVDFGRAKFAFVRLTPFRGARGYQFGDDTDGTGTDVDSWDPSQIDYTGASSSSNTPTTGGVPTWGTGGTGGDGDTDNSDAEVADAQAQAAASGIDWLAWGDLIAGMVKAGIPVATALITAKQSGAGSSMPPSQQKAAAAAAAKANGIQTSAISTPVLLGGAAILAAAFYFSRK